MAPQLPPKKDVAIALLQGPSVFVHIDPRKDGVVVPQWFKGKPQLVLQVGINMAVPIHDLDVGDEGIGGTLSFNRQPHWCFMPWTAIYALVGEDQRGMIWPEDVPPELAAQQKRPALSVVDKGSKGKPRAIGRSDQSGETRKRPHLAAVPSQPDDEDAVTEPAKPSEEPVDELDATDELAVAGADDSTAPPEAKKPAKGDDDAKAEAKADETEAKADDAQDADAEETRAAQDTDAQDTDAQDKGDKDGGAKGEGKRELPPYLRVIK